MALEYVTLTGTIPGGGGATVTFALSQWLTDAADALLIPPKPEPVNLAPDGSFSVQLMANDSPSIPTGSSWTMTVAGIAGVPPISWTFNLLYADGTTQDISGLATIPSPTPVAPCMPAPDGTPAAGDVPVVIADGSPATAWGPGGGDGDGSGTVTSVSVATANGFEGTVADDTSTPAITLKTAVTGLLKGNGTAISAATAGTDYLAPDGDGSALTGITPSQAGADPSGSAASAQSAAETYADAAASAAQSAAETASDAAGSAATAQSDAEAFATSAVSAEASRAETAEALKLAKASNLSDVADQQTALDNVAGAQTSGRYLRGDGTHVGMAAIEAADVPTLNQDTTGSSGSCGGNAATATNLAGGATVPAYLAPTVTALSQSGGTVAVDASLGNAFNLSVSGSWTISNPANPQDGQVIRFRLTSGGSNTTSWGTAYDFGAGTAPTLSATSAKVDIVAFEYVASISKWCCLGSGLGY